jgi:hypothetical protein
MEQDRTIVFMDFTTLGEASIVKGALESNSIPCFLSNENNPYIGSILTDSFGGIRLHIFEKDKDKADELMNLINSAVDDDDLWDPEDLSEVSD